MKSLLFSYGVHLLILCFFYLSPPRSLHPEALPYHPPLRVDLVALPQQRIEPLSTLLPILATLTPTTTPSAPARPSLGYRPYLEKKNLNILQQFKKETFQSIPHPPKKIAGNHLSQGVDDSPHPSSTRTVLYYTLLEKHIKAHWVLPHWLAHQVKQAKIHLFINAQGDMLDHSFQPSSRDLIFDRYVEMALEASLPFPRPPAELIQELEQQGVLIGFP